MSMCRVVSCVVGRWCLLWPVHSLGKTLLSFALLHFVHSKAKCACYSRYLLISYFCIPVTYNEKDNFCCVSSRKSCRSSLNCSTSASLAFVVVAQTWFTVILNCLSWKRREIILSFLRLHQSISFWTFFFNYEGYSISSKGFLLIVADIMVIWIKFTHSCPFKFTDSSAQFSHSVVSNSLWPHGLQRTRLFRP